MVDLLKKIIKNLHFQIESEFTCLIKFDQNKFIPIETYSNENIKLDLSKILFKDSHLDFSEIQNKLKHDYNFNSQILNNFTFGNSHYFLLSAYFSPNIENKNYFKLQTSFTEIIKETTKLIEEKSK